MHTNHNSSVTIVSILRLKSIVLFSNTTNPTCKSTPLSSISPRHKLSNSQANHLPRGLRPSRLLVHNRNLRRNSLLFHASSPSPPRPPLPPHGRHNRKLLTGLQIRRTRSQSTPLQRLQITEKRSTQLLPISRKPRRYLHNKNIRRSFQPATDGNGDGLR